MKLSRFFIIAIILGIIQVTLVNYFKFFWVKPDLFLLIVFMAALFLEKRKALGIALLSGLFKSVFGMGAFGPDIIIFVILSFIIIKVSREIVIDDNLSRALLLFAVAIVYNILTGIILIYSGSFVPPGIFLRIIFLSPLYTALIFLLILKLSKIKT